MLNTTIQHTSRNYITTLKLVQSSKDVNKNSSEITYSLSTVFTGTSGAWASTPYGFTASIVINGTTISVPKMNYDFRQYKSKTWKTGSITIPHNSDGAKSINASFSYTTDNTYFVAGSASKTSMVLESIARTSSFTLNKTSVQLGSPFVVTISPAVSTYSHKIYLVSGSKDSLVADVAASETTKTITPSSLQWQQTFSGSSTEATVRVVTYNGKTQLGSTTKKLTLTANSTDSKPGLSITVSTVNGLNGKFFKGVTALKISLSPSLKYEATAESYSVSVKSGNTILYSSTSSSFTTNVINVSGKITISATVTDSRDMVGAAVREITFEDYFKPYISSETNYRVNANNEDDVIGDYAMVGGVSRFKTGLGNTLTFKVEYKEKTASTWIQVFNQTGITTDNYKKEQRVSANSEKEYDLRITLSDGVVTNVFNYKILTGKVIIDIHSTGEGLGIGTSVGEAKLINVNTNWATIGGRGYVLNNVNLNDVNKQGIYAQKLNASATSYYNYPEEAAGVLEVFIIDNSGYMIFQRYTAWESKTVYLRTRYGTIGWSSWESIGGKTQRGYEVVENVESKQVKTVTVMYPRSFKKAPTIAATLSSGAPQLYSVGVHGVTTHGFKLTVYNGHTTSVNLPISWVATDV